MDNIFNQQKDTFKARESLRARKQSVAPGSLPMSSSAPNLEASASVAPGVAPFQPPVSTAREPTEVILYGFGNDAQWAAIEHFEKVSGGIIYEDYDRNPPTSKYHLPVNLNRAAAIRSLSKTQLRRINEYVGGNHWIKVTFDSADAAERACHYSPHILQGFQVFAERYRGTPPTTGDVAIRGDAGPLSSATGSPHTMSSTTLPLGRTESLATNASSTTVSSNTATTSVPASFPSRGVSEPVLRPGAFPDGEEPSVRPSRPNPGTAASTTTTATTTSVKRSPDSRSEGRTTLRVRGAKPVVLLPAEQAFLPAASRWQQTFGSLPVIGWLVGSGHGLIGDQVPRKEDGTFDHDHASIYWRFMYMVDGCFGTDFCGVKGEADDE